MESSLRLIMEKGPRAGETLYFKPRFMVRIGRIVRGNTVSIKDAGISSKHLTIEQNPSGKWTITDLDSSNGTLLNSLDLDPGKPFDLRDGDEVKIGEITSFRVQFFEVEAAQIGRKPRGKPPLPKNATKCEAKKGGSEGAEVKRDESVKGHVEDVGVDGGGVGGNIEEKGNRGGRQSRRSSRRDVAVAGNCESSAVKEKHPHGAPLDGDANGGPGNHVLTGSKYPQAGRRGRKRDAASRQNVDDSEQTVAMEIERSQEGLRVHEEAIDVGRDENTGGESHSPVEDCKPMKNDDGVIVDNKEGPVVTDVGCGQEQRCKNGQNRPNLAEMTLGEWFDYLEVHFTRQVHTATEEVVADIRRKANLVQKIIQGQRQKMRAS